MTNISIPVLTVQQLKAAAKTGLDAITALTKGVSPSRLNYMAISQLSYVLAELPDIDSSNTPIKPAKRGKTKSGVLKAVKARVHKKTTLYHVKVVEKLPKGFMDIHTLQRVLGRAPETVYRALRSCRSCVRFENRVHAPLAQVRAAL